MSQNWFPVMFSWCVLESVQATQVPAVVTLMEHEPATQLMPTERYLLGELTDVERDQFEDHFFDCPACAEDVRQGVIFMANARAVFADRR